MTGDRLACLEVAMSEQSRDELVKTIVALYNQIDDLERSERKLLCSNEDLKERIEHWKKKFERKVFAND